jgi:hypothetical protein
MKSSFYGYYSINAVTAYAEPAEAFLQILFDRLSVAGMGEFAL